jgi:hypothetical protein
MLPGRADWLRNVRVKPWMDMETLLRRKINSFGWMKILFETDFGKQEIPKQEVPKRTDCIYSRIAPKMIRPTILLLGGDWLPRSSFYRAVA